MGGGWEGGGRVVGGWWAGDTHHDADEFLPIGAIFRPRFENRAGLPQLGVLRLALPLAARAGRQKVPETSPLVLGTSLEVVVLRGGSFVLQAHQMDRLPLREEPIVGEIVRPIASDVARLEKRVDRRIVGRRKPSRLLRRACEHRARFFRCHMFGFPDGPVWR